MNVGLKRDTTDKFYTKTQIANWCVDEWKRVVEPEHDDIIIEPSAGNGSFIQKIKSLNIRYGFYDIKPEHTEIESMDFLNWNPDIFDNIDDKEKKKKFHFIGNPPFGRQSSMAKRFIKHASKYADSIAFILPKSFQKESMQKAFPLHFHCIYEVDIPVNSFMIHNEEYDVSCIFQVWKRKSYYRDIAEKQTPKGFKFVKKNENPHISFRRVGVYAGNVSRDIEDKSIQSHYFIRFDSFTNELFSLLQTLDYDGKDKTVGARSISKPEVISAFNSIRL